MGSDPREMAAAALKMVEQKTAERQGIQKALAGSPSRREGGVGYADGLSTN